MPKKPAKKRTPRTDAGQRGMSAVLQATGLSELKPVKPTRKTAVKKPR